METQETDAVNSLTDVQCIRVIISHKAETKLVSHGSPQYRALVSWLPGEACMYVCMYVFLFYQVLTVIRSSLRQSFLALVLLVIRTFSNPRFTCLSTCQHQGVLILTRIPISKKDVTSFSVHYDNHCSLDRN